MADPTLSKKRYIPILEAAKVSGYTREYIERLCRIGKIPCRAMGDTNIVELDALLSQTGTILMGGEHLGFIDVGENSPYPLMTPTGEASAPIPVAEKPESRQGHIAVVGETVRGDDTDTPRLAVGEKFPSNALPFFSSMAGGAKKSGFHIPVADMNGDVLSSVSRPASAPKEKPVVHLAIGGDAHSPTPMSSVLPLTPVPESRPSKLKSISVMPSELPVGFVPAIPIQQPQSLPAIPSPVSSGPVTGSAPQHDHDMMQYSSKLPMLLQPLSLSKKALLAMFALGLFVAPTALGVGKVLNGVIITVGSSLHTGARGAMAAVGLINPNQDIALFPYLQETSRLLSASGASGNGQTQNGVVVTPSTGNTTNDQGIKDAIQKTFSDPVQVIPDGNGQSGIIRPVFQKNNSAGYIYMMVPVRN